jgi:hypothetical protein
MRPPLLLPALLTFAFALSPADAQQTAPQQAVPQPAQTPKPAAPKPKPKPKPVAAKKPAAPAPEAKAKLLEKIKDWAVYIHDSAEGRVCFAATAPSDMQPKTAKRTPVVFYVTTWQKEGVHNEVSVKQGYAMKANATATVTVGGQTFTLTADDDKVYAKDPAEERKLLVAMGAGGSMTVKAAPAKGAATTDRYSLDGLALAMQKLQEACP